MKTAAILVAGGKGLRAGFETPKQFLPLCGKPIVDYSLELFELSPLVQEVILVLPKDFIAYFKEKILPEKNFTKLKKIIEGGETRQASTFAGFQALSESTTQVCVHDAARPLLSAQDLERVLKQAQEKKAAILAAPASDTIKEVDPDKAIMETYPREKIYLAQTPQVFERGLLQKAFEEALADHFVGTDEASLVERLGEKVFIVESNMRNLKLTHPEDFKIAELFLREGKES